MTAQIFGPVFVLILFLVVPVALIDVCDRLSARAGRDRRRDQMWRDAWDEYNSEEI